MFERSNALLVCRSAKTSEQEAVNPIYLLAWIPERLLNEKGPDEWDKFVRMEDRIVVDDEDEGVFDLFPKVHVN